jgi:hypothetical protein
VAAARESLVAFGVLLLLREAFADLLTVLLLDTVDRRPMSATETASDVFLACIVGCMLDKGAVRDSDALRTCDVTGDVTETASGDDHCPARPKTNDWERLTAGEDSRRSHAQAGKVQGHLYC